MPGLIWSGLQISGFYVGENPPTHLVRFCYCKEDGKLSAAAERLRKYLLGQQ